MVFLYSALIVLVALLVMLNANRWFANSRRHSKLPPKGRATMFDVRHLLMEGEKDLAVEVYCEIFNTTPHKAKKDIEELQRSLKV